MSRWTRKGEIERVMERWVIWHIYGPRTPADEHKYLRRILNRFARKIIKEEQRKAIKDTTEVLALRERVATLEERIGVMADLAHSTYCPPGRQACKQSVRIPPDCARCWSEWGLA